MDASAMTCPPNPLLPRHPANPQASRFQDPVTGDDVTMLIQTDVTARVTAERQLQQVRARGSLD